MGNGHGGNGQGGNGQVAVATTVAADRPLRSRAYETGRLSVRREGGEHLFHQLLHADLTSGCSQP